LTSKVNLILY